jgi:hypothetical protein
MTKEILLLGTLLAMEPAQVLLLHIIMLEINGFSMKYMSCTSLGLSLEGNLAKVQI